MLLPSALPCDARGSSATRPALISAPSFPASPPLSDEEAMTSPRLNGLFSSCKALQSMLMIAPPGPVRRLRRTTAITPTGLSNPIALPLTPSPASPRPKANRVAPPRGANKRRRAPDDDDTENKVQRRDIPHDQLFSTPKRMRLAPPNLPLGLSSSDFEALESTPASQLNSREGLPERPLASQATADWSPADDRALVELVLEKLKLSKGDWADCARALGRDQASVDERWKSLVGNGRIGLGRGNVRSRQSRTTVADYFS
ncbi:MAG: hypothetical protein M1825_000979 [Sarcosagium campestre]|nr:MAG: hypothetical protein M1825_000979 [Sarcosagium campestre]